MSHVHFQVHAMNDDGDWEEPLPPYMKLDDARAAALDIAEDYPRGVRITRVVITSETVWTNGDGLHVLPA